MLCVLYFVNTIYKLVGLELVSVRSVISLGQYGPVTNMSLNEPILIDSNNGISSFRREVIP